MKVKVHLMTQAQPVEYDYVENCYVKGGLYCVWVGGEVVHKYPLCNIHKVTETYNKTKKKGK